MGTVVLMIALCLLLPLLLLMFYQDKKSRMVSLSCIAGILACLLAYRLNGTINGLVDVSEKYFTTTLAPITEEILKFLPIFLLSIPYAKERDKTAVLAFAVGVGFCVVENFYYLINGIANADITWVVLRSIGTGLMHGMSSTVIGLGIYYSRREKRMTALCVLTTLFFAFMYHGLYNLLVQSTGFRMIGVFLPILTYLLILILLKKENIGKFLFEDRSGEAKRRT